jgi:hypothetical protein
MLYEDRTYVLSIWAWNFPINYVLNTVWYTTLMNMMKMWNFQIVSDKFNTERNSISVHTSSKNKNNSNNNDDDDNNNNNN